MSTRRVLAGALLAVVAGAATWFGAVSAANTILVQDSFQRPNQAGWGVSSDGNAWSAGSGLSIVSNKGAISFSGSSQFVTLGTATAADVEGLVRFTISVPNETAGVILRRQANGDYYLVRYNGAGAVELRQKSSGVSSVLATAPFSPGGSAAWLRFQLNGPQAMVKVWPDAQIEPAAWTRTASAAAVTSAGQAGLYGWAAGSSSVRFDSFAVTVLGVVPVPSPSPSASPSPSPSAAPSPSPLPSPSPSPSPSPAPSGTVAQDDFVGPNQAGWGVASDGSTWSAGSGLSIVSNHGAISSSGASQFETLGSNVAADVEGVVRFSVTASNETAGIILRRQSSGAMYLLRYNGASAVELRYKSGSAWTNVASVSFKPSSGVAYWMRVRMTGAQGMFQVWPDGQPEPAGWAWTGASPTVTSAGQVGLYGWAAGSASVRFDSFAVVALPAPPPPPTPAPGSLFITYQTRTGVLNGPSNNQAETDVNWKDSATGSGWQVGVVPGYGGANISFWSEISNGVAGPTQTSLVTTTPSGLMHEFTNINAAFTGSEDYDFAPTQTTAPGAAVWIAFRSVVPAVGTDTNGLRHIVTTYIYPGDPGLLIQRFDLVNPSSQPITLSSSDSIELVLIGGLEQADATWRPINGTYGTVGGPAGVWPQVLTAGDPDYYWIAPDPSSGVQVAVEGVRKTGLRQAGAGNLMFAYQQNSHRLKIDARGDLASIPANGTVTFYALQVLSRGLDATSAASIAADYLSPASPAMTDGAFASFSYDDGAYHFSTTTGTSLRFSLAMDSVDSSRWLTAFTVNNWTGANPPAVAVGGRALVAGVDYVSAVDPATHTAWVKLLKRLSSLPGAANSIVAGTIALS